VSKICDIWDRSPDNEGYRQIIVWNRASLFGHPGPGSELEDERTESSITSAIRIWYIQLPAYEGRHRRRSRSKFIPQQSTILFPRIQGMAACVLVLCFDKQCGWLSGAKRHPPYHVAMTRSSSRLTLLRSPSSTSTMYQGDVRGGLTENHFDVSDNSTMANYAMKLRTRGSL
jgi:hypothetical protein